MGARPMARLIQDTIRKALADELLFGKLVTGGRVTVDLDENEQIKLDFAEGDAAAACARRNGRNRVTPRYTARIHSSGFGLFLGSKLS